MGYITPQRVAEIRRQVKELYPTYKFSITRDGYSGVSITILEAPYLFTEKKYEQVNVYYVKDIKDPIKRSVVESILKIANEGVTTYETGDYGSQPSHYVYIHFGEWDRPFKLIIPGTNGKPVAAVRIKSLQTI